MDRPDLRGHARQVPRPQGDRGPRRRLPALLRRPLRPRLHGRPGRLQGRQPTEYLKQLYFDSLIFSPEAIRHLAVQVGAIVLGSDYPYPWQLKPVDHIFACDSLSDEQKVAVLGGTAAKLLNIAG